MRKTLDCKGFAVGRYFAGKMVAAGIFRVYTY